MTITIFCLNSDKVLLTKDSLYYHIPVRVKLMFTSNIEEIRIIDMEKIYVNVKN